MVDFADDANWLGLYGNLIMGVLGNPIAPITLASSLNHRFLRIAANNQNALATWSLGAYAYFLVDEDNPQVQAGTRIFCDVNRPIIVPVPDWLPSYRLRVKPPKWFDEISLQVEGYIGDL
jgi:hypothetical protein